MNAFTFLRDVLAGYEDPSLWIELRIRVGNRMDIRWFPLTEYGLHRASLTSVEAAASHDVYFGVLPRCRPHGVKSSIQKASILYAEIDGASEGQDGAVRLLASGVAERRVPSPSIVVLSGGGVHCYWRLSDCIDVPSFEFSLLLKRLCFAIGKVSWKNWTRVLKPDGSGSAFPDPVSTDTTRILRVAGTWNHKEGRYCPVRQIEAQGDRPLCYSDWDRLLPRAPPPKEVFIQAHQKVITSSTGLPDNLDHDLHRAWPDNHRYDTIRRILFVAHKEGLPLWPLIDIFRSYHPGSSIDFEQLVRSTDRI